MDQPDLDLCGPLDRPRGFPWESGAFKPLAPEKLPAHEGQRLEELELLRAMAAVLDSGSHDVRIENFRFGLVSYQGVDALLAIRDDGQALFFQVASRMDGLHLEFPLNELPKE